MFVIDEAKLPPPSPVSAAHIRYGHSGSPGWPSARACRPSGSAAPAPRTSSSSARRTSRWPACRGCAGQLRPGWRAPREELVAALKPYTDRGMNSTITDQMDQIENPMCSATTDQIRLRRAIFVARLPSHVSSGSQSAIRCERASGYSHGSNHHAMAIRILCCPGAVGDDPGVNFRSLSPRPRCESGHGVPNGQYNHTGVIRMWRRFRSRPTKHPLCASRTSSPRTCPR